MGTSISTRQHHQTQPLPHRQSPVVRVHVLETHVLDLVTHATCEVKLPKSEDDWSEDLFHDFQMVRKCMPIIFYCFTVDSST